MKRLFLLLTLGAALACPSMIQAQDSTNAPPSGPPPGGGGWGGGHHMDFLTDAQKAELKKAHDAAIAADPSLETEGKDLMEKMKAAHDSGEPMSEDLKEEGKAFHEKMDAAMVKADPDVAPVLAEIKAHHHHHDGDAGGPPAPPPAGA
jgi:Spy/CpxP family protein refolding chaperone